MSECNVVAVDDGQTADDGWRLLLLQDVDDKLGLGDVTGAIGGTKPEVKLLIVGLRVQRSVQEDPTRVAIQTE